jgi:uncharacterized membrane protein HdeD (DUF308 family)
MSTLETPSVVRRLWKSTLALGVLTLIVGAAVLVWPGQSIVVAGVLFGVYLLASGIAQVVAAFTVYRNFSRWMSPVGVRRLSWRSPGWCSGLVG